MPLKKSSCRSLSAAYHPLACPLLCVPLQAFCLLMDSNGPDLRSFYLPGLEGLKEQLAVFEYLLDKFHSGIAGHLKVTRRIELFCAPFPCNRLSLLLMALLFFPPLCGHFSRPLPSSITPLLTARPVYDARDQNIAPFATFPWEVVMGTRR